MQMFRVLVWLFLQGSEIPSRVAFAKTSSRKRKGRSHAHAPARRQYTAMPFNYTECTHGVSILDDATCQDAAIELGLSYAGSEMVDNVPRGCYEYSAGHGYNDQLLRGHVYLNTHRTGGSSGSCYGCAPICQLVHMKRELDGKMRALGLFEVSVEDLSWVGLALLHLEICVNIVARIAGVLGTVFVYASLFTCNFRDWFVMLVLINPVRYWVDMATVWLHLDTALPDIFRVWFVAVPVETNSFHGDLLHEVSVGRVYLRLGTTIIYSVLVYVWVLRPPSFGGHLLCKDCWRRLRLRRLVPAQLCLDLCGSILVTAGLYQTWIKTHRQYGSLKTQLEEHRVIPLLDRYNEKAGSIEGSYFCCFCLGTLKVLIVSLRRLVPWLACVAKSLPLKRRKAMGLGIRVLAAVQCDCVFCLEEPADCVFSGCGHLTYCQSCRLRVLEKAMGSEWRRTRNHNKRLRFHLACPLCRKVSQTFLESEFVGIVYGS